MQQMLARMCMVGVKMDIGMKFMDIRHLKRLSEEIENIASDSLKNTIKEYIASTRDSNYLCNILNSDELRELEQLTHKCVLMSLW